MGIDGIDFNIRLEKAFGFAALPGEVLRLYFPVEQLPNPRPPTTATMGQIHDRLCEFLVERGRAVPADSWQRVQQCASKCLSVPCPASSGKADSSKIWVRRD